MIRLSAESWDCDGAPEPGGTVCRLFERTCYLRDAAGGMIPITDHAVGVMPRGLRVDLPSGTSFHALVAIGNRAATRGGVLRFEGGLSVDLRRSRRWGPILRCTHTPNASVLKTVQATLRKMVRDRAPVILPVIDRLQRSPDGMRAATAGLIGLGPGLTPAGDDYLVGLAAGIHVHGSDSAAGAGDALNQGIAAALAQTTDVSRVLLEGALRGVFPERLVDLVDVLQHPRPPADIDTAVRALASFGHSSGTVMGLGLIDALAVQSGFAEPLMAAVS